MSLAAPEPDPLEQAAESFLARLRAGERPTLSEYEAKHPELAADIRALFPALALLEDGRHGAGHPPAPDPAYLGRYRVEKLLGEGGFGRVYLAYDEPLRRLVAVKVPRPDRAALPGYADAYLAEARILAQLKHPHIVPVYDVGQTDDGLPFVVSAFIPGFDLAHQLRHARPPFAAAAELVATVAEALHHAHRHGVVHRDIKPGNILLDEAGAPHVADFGLALREEDFGKGAGFAGTPAYMSPEQARGEGHRVDGRSDIFSLGVVVYELLTGRRPFHADSRDELLELIATVEVRPPRQIDDTLPRELERICLKALAKRASDRYTTAKDLSDDLRYFLAAPSAAAPSAPTGVGSPLSPDQAPSAPPATLTAPPSDRTPARIVPKGLRSFDAHDADFFLELLPGPRDRDGLPDSLRFWKTRIEETDPDGTFAVGLIYGPSGCGKSSLVKAGLLPRLAEHVLPVYVEATGDQTEARLLAGLGKCCAATAADGGLKAAVAALRRGQGLAAGQKVVIVLDQFEQWLHAQRGEADPELVQALRQCDGGRVQCLVLVRDDFWLAISRFLKALEVPLIEGQNCALVDLFDPDHARKVLAAFGRAFGKLPEGVHDATQEQLQFLNQAVVALAQGGKIICVRLALFAEMMKGRPWAPATLKGVGGVEGVGATFLEETFSAAGAPPHHRYHQKAARAVLKALLPEVGTDIKGHLRSRRDLEEASGYAARPREFEELLQILDGEVRLITPTDPEGSGGEDGPQSNLPVSQRYYQLTHDYLVPSLRDWLTRKQRETRRGRAELRLIEWAALWNSKPENRHLPAWWEWLNIRLFTRKKDWSPPQRQMMRQAGRSLAVRGTLMAASLLLLLWAGWEGFGRLRAQALLDNLLRAPTEDVPAVVRDMAPYRRWLNEPLRQAYAEAAAGGDARKQLHASLALLPVDAGQVEYLYGRLLTAEPPAMIALREALRPHAGTLGERLWAVLEDPGSDPGKRLRAACALAGYAEDDGRWPKVSRDVTGRLVAENALVMGRWAEALRPVRRHLLPPLAALLQEGRGAAERRTLARLYGDYAEGLPDAFGPLEKVLSEQVGAGAIKAARLALARRQANAAVVLAALGRWEKVSPLLRHVPDPTLQSYVIDALELGGVEARAVLERLSPERELDVSARRALLLALGEFGEDRLPRIEREALVPRLLAWYRDDPDPGIHGVAGWLLRRWQQQGKVEEIDRHLATGKVEGKRRWYVNSQGQTLVVVPPGEFEMGEADRRPKVRIEYSFALSAREVTVAEFCRFRKDHQYFKDTTPTEDCPVNMVSWYDAAAYCNWLSKVEGIAEEQWCYVPNEKGEYAAGMQVKANALRLSGYRLPTEAEWEYACRAGSVTTWSLGEAIDLLGKYAWYAENSPTRSRPVGLLRPNELGLFDLHGNVWEWCQNRNVAFMDIKALQIDEIVDGRFSRVLRGGSFNDKDMGVDSAHRYFVEPAHRNMVLGIRPARTFR
jgi:serine/threonine protein kinase/formylglycine-generating enzyme required for sulfatase activity